MRTRLGLVVVAAGASRRMDGVDKVWEPLDGHPVVWHSVQALHSRVDGIVVVVRKDNVERARALFLEFTPTPIVVVGGVERQDSVLCGLQSLPAVDAVAVHDGARPLVTPDILDEGMRLLQTCDGVVPGDELHDTVKHVDRNGWVVRTEDRAHLRTIQTPQIFCRDVLEVSHHYARRHRSIFTDDAGMAEAAGYRIRVFAGARTNFKITTAHDLDLARYNLSRMRHS